MSEQGCAKGTVCVNVGDVENWDSVFAECVPKESACGGPGNAQCAPGLVCKYGPYVASNNGWDGPSSPAETESNGGYGRCVAALDAGDDVLGDVASPPIDASVGD